MASIKADLNRLPDGDNNPPADEQPPGRHQSDRPADMSSKYVADFASKQVADTVGICIAPALGGFRWSVDALRVSQACGGASARPYPSDR